MKIDTRQKKIRKKEKEAIKPPFDEQLFYALRGYKVSVLIDNFTKAGIRESYVGVVREVTEGYVFLDTNENRRIGGIYLPYFMILSVWLYR